MRTGAEELLDEVRLLWHAMTQAGDRLHEKEPITLGKRGVLEYLSLHGPSAVPRISRARHVTRQHIQTLTNALRERGLVALEPNPEHRRSPLVRMTQEGRDAIERMKRRERRLFERLDLAARGAELKQATETLRSVRTALGGNP